MKTIGASAFEMAFDYSNNNAKRKGRCMLMFLKQAAAMILLTAHLLGFTVGCTPQAETTPISYETERAAAERTEGGSQAQTGMTAAVPKPILTRRISTGKS